MGSPHSLQGLPSEEDDGQALEYEDQLLLRYANDANESSATIPLPDQAVVELEADKWAELWQESSTYCEPVGLISDEALELLTPWSIIQAAHSFPVGTATGADNIAPRAVARLSQEGLKALALIYAALERLGSWTAAFAFVLIVLLPKTDGGLRPIGLFPTLIRIWMRSRL